jgi:hypothetical protein
MKKLMKAVAALMLMTAVVYPAESMNAQTHKGHAYVDLGLPSGTLWATCNVGANNPWEYGNYYAWGETKTKKTYDWNTYKYAKGDNAKLTKYCKQSDYGNNGFEDKLTTLQSSDDAATANWGSGWCMPTKEQWEELLNCTMVSDYRKLNGVYGMLFMGYNGNQLFLPAAGYQDHSIRWDREPSGAGSYGYYWSRSLNTFQADGAWRLELDSDDCHMYNHFNRNDGCSVRPVRKN